MQIRFDPTNQPIVTPGMHIRIQGYETTNQRSQPIIQVNTLEIIGSGYIPQLPNTERARRYPEHNWLANRETFNNIVQRSLIIQQIRNYLIERRFIEIDTPTLQRVYGGADATPYTTETNSGQERFLRIAPELYLKRAVIGGFDRVFEIGHNFRNESRDRTHSPEFTFLEVYEAYADWSSGIAMLQEIMEMTCNDRNIRVIPMRNLVEEFTRTAVPNVREMLRIFEEQIEPTLIEPVIVTHFPAFCSPLAEPDPGNPEMALRYELYANGMEIANGYQELRSPDAHTESVDPDYIESLRLGLPQTSGLGIGIDRLIMRSLNQNNILNCIPFPPV